MREISVFVSHAMTGAPEAFLEEVKWVKFSLNTLKNVRVLNERATRTSDQDNVHVRDMREITRSHKLIAFVDVPSIGVGIEIQQAVIMLKPIICLHRTPKSGITRMLADAERAKMLEFLHFESKEHAFLLAQKFLGIPVANVTATG